MFFCLGLLCPTPLTHTVFQAYSPDFLSVSKFLPFLLREKKKIMHLTAQVRAQNKNSHLYGVL